MSHQKPSYGVWGRFVQRLAVFLAPLLLAAAPLAAAPTHLVLALGDSLTAGYGLTPGQSVPARLEARLRAQGYDVRVHNGGVSGDTSAQGRARLTWLLASLPRTPDVVIVELGANDMLRGLPPAQAEANLDAILRTLHQRKIKILLAGMLAAPNLGQNYAQQFNSIYPRLARRYSATLDPFFMQDVAGQSRLLLADKMHPNAQGTDIIAARLAPKVARLLGPAK